MTSTLPAALKMLTCPFDPNATSTRFGTVCPLTQLRLDASGRGTPAGHTVRKLGAVVFVTVTFRTTALTPVDGTETCPAIWTFRFPPGPTGAPERVSRIRVGATA